MEIQLVMGHGEGRTKLAAYDAALRDGGIFNYNIIHMSSILPPNSTVTVTDKYDPSDEHFGERLYVVGSSIQSDQKGEAIGAGLGWYQFGDGRGIIVEHTRRGYSEDLKRQKLEEAITNTLNDIAVFRDHNFDPANVKFRTQTTIVGDLPASVVIYAIFKAELW